MQKSWFRFVTAAGTVYGEAQVPGTPPKWFEETLERMNSGARRTLTMSDFSVEEWLDILSSKNLPIALLRPLSPQPQEEVVFFIPERFTEMKQTVATLSKGSDNKPGIPQAAILDDDNFIRKFGYFMEDFEKVPAEEKPKYQPVPRKNMQPTKARTFVNYVPLVDPQSDDEDDQSYTLYPMQISSRVNVKSTHRWAKMVDTIWGRSIETAAAADLPKILAP